MKRTPQRRFGQSRVAVENAPGRLDKFWPLFALVLLTSPALAGGPVRTAQDGAVDFAHDIEPILEENCWKCHGPKKQRAGLRLDNKAAALAGADFGADAVILPGDAQGSTLLQLLITEDEDERMPPRGDALPAEQVELIRRWIEGGAEWPDTAAEAGAFSEHWAYNAPVDSPLPEPEGMNWVRNEIDRFVLARLEKEGLAPSAEAEPETLLRRLCLDLTGLPPTLQQREQFWADLRSGAGYEPLVERLLASPHYGERMARGWLDIARYADTNGYEKDSRRSIWRYRDWVIDAYNADMGFDQFTLEQIAGDLLPDPSLEQRIATGFHRNTMVNAEGGVDPEESRVAAILDRVNTTASVWLGSTMACAQCHTHKYDPFSQQDYYRMFAYFNSSSDIGPGDGPRLSAPTEGMAQLEADAVAELARLNEVLSERTPEIEAQFESELAEALRAETEWEQWIPNTYTANEATTLALLNEGSLLAIGDDPTKGTYDITFELPAGDPVRRIRIEALTHDSLPNGGTARSTHQNFVLSEVTLTRAVIGSEDAEEAIPVARAAADHHQTGSPDWPASGAVDGSPGTGWAIGGAVGKAHNLVLELESPLEPSESTTVRMRLDQNYGGAHMLGHLRFSTSTQAGTGRAPLDGEITVLLRAPEESLGEHKEVLREWHRSTTALLDEPRARKAELESRPALPTTLVMKELAEPRTTNILERGSFLSPGKAVLPGVPMFLPQPPSDSPPNRLGLARWLTSSNNPLTTRVTVNRLWDQVFGRGLVATSEDFGTQGEPPSHPALLDWLALTFERDGWSTKNLVRRIVNSATYRQSSHVSQELLERDPQNRLLARGARYRVESEMVRDIALTASGLLNASIGGPSVFPPQPEGVWQITYSSDRWVADTGKNRFRRGLYTFWRRTAPYPAFMAFDATSRELACVRRNSSNTPLQALALLNDPAFVETAVALAGKLMRTGEQTDRERIAIGFTLCTGRTPEPEEIEVLLQLLESERAQFTSDPDAAQKLTNSEAELGVDEFPRPELAAWTVVCNVLLNLDETITRS